MRLSLKALALTAGFIGASAQAADVRTFECVGMNHEQAVQSFILSFAPDPSQPSLGIVWKDAGSISGNLESVTFFGEPDTEQESSSRTAYLAISGIKYRTDLMGLTGENLAVQMHAVEGSDEKSPGLEADCKRSDIVSSASLIKQVGSSVQLERHFAGWTRFQIPAEFKCSFIDKGGAPWSASFAISPNPSGGISDYGSFLIAGETFEGELTNFSVNVIDGHRVVSGLSIFKNGESTFLTSIRLFGGRFWVDFYVPKENAADIPYGKGVCLISRAQGLGLKS